PFEGPRKREYPMPPLRWTAFHEKMAAAAKSLGWHPFPGPAAINSRSYQNRSGCMYHGFCATGGCHVDAKNSTAVTTIPRAQATGRFKAVFPFDIGAWYGLPAQGVAIDNWADDNWDHSGVDFIGGVNLWAMSDRRPIGASGMNTFGLAPAWGSQWKAFIRQNADRSHSS